VIFFIAIRHEGAYRELKFGATYITHKTSVQRWL